MLKKLFALLFIGITGLFFVSAWFFSTKILHLEVTDCDVEHYVFCGDPSEQNIAFEDITYQSIDGLTLPGWYMPAINVESNKAILLLHGRGANRTEGMRYAKVLLNAGYNVLAIDMRHPRQDPKRLSTMGYHEKKDVLGSLDYLENIKGMQAIGVMGFSMGAAIGITVMAQDSRVKVGVFNGGYANSMDVLSEQGKRLYGVPRYPLMPMVELLFSWRGQVEMNEINPETYIGQISPRPIYIMHGTADKTVDFQHGQRLYDAAREPKQFWPAKGGEHTRLWQLDKVRAENSVVAFFTTYLK